MKPGYTALLVTYAGLGRSLVSRLVCAAFHGAPLPGAITMHLDDNPTRNVPSNLKWGTHAENLSAPGSRARVRESWVRRKALIAEQKALQAA